MVARSPRVLVVAEAANPEWSSVPLVGWNTSRALAAVVDAHVVTQVRNREAIERTGWRDGREFTSIDSEAFARPVYLSGAALRRMTGLGWTTTTAFSAASYYFFEHLLWRRFGEAIADRQYDVVHRVTPLSPTVPSLIAKRCRRLGVPFVWGPVNGGVPWPSEFKHVQRQEGEWLSHVRWGHKLLPGYRSSRAEASALIAGSRSVWEQLKSHHDRCVYIVENAVDPERFGRRATFRSDGPLRVAFVGRLVPYKGADMLIEAAAPLVRSGRVLLDIIGDGPEMAVLKQQVAREQIGGGVVLEGWIDHKNVGARLAKSEVFAFPSVREFGGAVVLEAMELGLVPVVVDYGGPAELVSKSTGFRLPLGPRQAIVTKLREVLSSLTARPKGMREMSDAAHGRVRRWFTWDVKARQITEVYRWVLGEREKPDFGMPHPDERNRDT